MRLSPVLDALLGYELETPDCRVEPFVPKGTLLLRGRGWDLETDKIPNRDLADLEFVIAPASDWTTFDRIADEITSLMARLRQLAMPRADRTVALTELAAGAPCAVVPEMRDRKIIVNGLHLLGRLQSTYGIGLDRIRDHLARQFPQEQALRVFARTDRAAEAWRRRGGTALSPAATGLLDLIGYYFDRANTIPAPGQRRTIHIHFPLFARSDFCAIHDLLLDDDERRQVAGLIMPDPDAGRTPYLEANGWDEHAPMFAHSYWTRSYELESGPRRCEWLASIVHGRGDGVLRKDLMSPPPGYGLHSGDLARDYGAGAMGVDPVRRLVLFEIRSTPGRHDLPLNAMTKCAMLREYLDAQQYNSSLRAACDLPPELRSRYETLRPVERAYAHALKLVKAVRDHRSDKIEWTRHVRNAIGPVRQRLTLLGRTGATGPIDERLARALPDLVAMTSWIDRIPLEPDDDWGRTQTGAALDRLRAIEAALWDAAGSMQGAASRTPAEPVEA
jgi:hypothetical protein